MGEKTEDSHDILDGGPLHGIDLEHVEKKIDEGLVQVFGDGEDAGYREILLIGYGLAYI